MFLAAKDDLIYLWLFSTLYTNYVLFLCYVFEVSIKSRWIVLQHMHGFVQMLLILNVGIACDTSV